MESSEDVVLRKEKLDAHGRSYAVMNSLLRTKYSVLE
jgi:hypothetical protein